MRARPISPSLLVEELADRIATLPEASWARVAIDGAPPARPGDLADALVDPLRLRGRDVLRVSAGDFLRPASLRFEYGREDPDAFYTDWLDEGGLVREVLGPLDPGGSGRVLPTLWDSAVDRATRASYVTLAPGGVLLLDGALLLGRGLPLDHAVHLSMSRAALARRTGPDEKWTLPAYERYEDETRPALIADVVVRVDDPRHPALIEQP
ncbi:nucleoside/nucleotide kinase family protein [Actinoallomurus rhizosphaericola]|uniref:uridine kinase n=1 Tax=Actinoallomurus rhizosphaericola TaxID=2952536 RepID=UPI002091975F|nr:uridine kinase [Actinoallomurus rhizosphaericola]MCO5994149.1 uridine kinase [Actinoallomurus rhizosphaericola]